MPAVLAVQPSSARLRFAILAVALAVFAAALIPVPGGLQTRASIVAAQAAVSQPLPRTGQAGIVSPQLRAALEAHRLARGVPPSDTSVEPATPPATPQPFDIEPAAGFDHAGGLPEAAPQSLSDTAAVATLPQLSAAFENHVAVSASGATLPAEAMPAETPRGFVVIGSFRNPAYVDQWIAKFGAWQPIVLPAVVEGVERSRVAVGPFAKADLKQALQQIRDAGVADAWLVTAPVSAETAFRTLSSLG